MADAHVELDYQAIGELLRSPEMEAEMRRRGENVLAVATARAPVAKEGSTRGRYKESFTIDSGRAGLEGATTLGDRAWCVVENTAPEALYVEYGNRGDQPLHLLLNALIEGARD